MAHSSTPAKQRRVAARKPKKQTATTIKPAKVSQKKLVQQDLFEACQKRGKFVFDNKLVKKMAEKKRAGFKPALLVLESLSAYSSAALPSRSSPVS